MRLYGKRVVPLVAVMFVLTQCCCCVGIPIMRSKASVNTTPIVAAAPVENAAAAARYRTPAGLIDYVSQTVQTLVQELR